MFDIDEVVEDVRPGSLMFREDYLRCLYMYAGWVPRGGTILEIGCYRGDSLMAILAGSHPTVTVHSIDPIFATGELTYPDVNAGTLTLSSALGDVMLRIAKYWRNNISIWPERSEDAFEFLGMNFPIDFLYVDGEHTYEAVKKDCRWLDRVRPGGFAAFDDWMAPIERAVREYISDRPEWTIVYESTWGNRDGQCITLLRKG